MTATIERSSVPLFRFWRDGDVRDRCDLVLEVMSDDLLSRHRQGFVKEIERQGYELANNGGGGNIRTSASVFVRIPVSDIWGRRAGDQAARLANGLLDMAEVDGETRLDLSVRGRKSLDGLRRARERQKQGDDQAFPWFVQAEDEPAFQKKVREKLASWLLWR